jgi:hypothetical protein
MTRILNGETAAEADQPEENLQPAAASKLA